MIQDRRFQSIYSGPILCKKILIKLSIESCLGNNWIFLLLWLLFTITVCRCLRHECEIGEWKLFFLRNFEVETIRVYWYWQACKGKAFGLSLVRRRMVWHIEGNEKTRRKLLLLSILLSASSLSVSLVRSLSYWNITYVFWSKAEDENFFFPRIPHFVRNRILFFCEL